MPHPLSLEIDALVCDLDGVLYRGDEAVPGAAEAVRRLRRRGLRVLYCTNNSRRTVSRYLDILRGHGLEAEAEDVLTSATVTAEHAAAHGLGRRAAYVVGGPGIREALSGAGIRVLDPDDEESDADLVVVGLDRDFTYRRLRRAALLVRAGAAFLGTNDDATYPAPGGEHWPGAGAMLAAVEIAGGRRAEVMGKPHRPMAEAAARRLGPGARVAVVGDRPETDLALADAFGWTKILVLSGVTDEAAAASAKPAPDLVVGSLAEIG